MNNLIKWSIEYFKIVELSWDSITWWWYCVRTGRYKEEDVDLEKEIND